MTRALSIETSNSIGSVAILEDAAIVGEDQFPHGLQHAAQIIRRIDGLCRERGWKPTDINEIYISIGPGSFTGLRIGVTLAKTIAFATSAKIVAVPTAHVLAQNAPPEASNLIIVLDAKREQIFTARFERENDLWIEREPAHLDDLQWMLARAPRPVWLLGEGIDYHRKFVPANDPSISETPRELWRPQAAAVARLGIELAKEKTFADPDRLTPLYIRKPEAQEVWERKQQDAPKQA